MANLYVGQNHRPLQITWVGTDLTGITGSNLSIIFTSRTDNGTFTGGGACATPVVTFANNMPTSTFNYTLAAGDVAADKVGEWLVRARCTYPDTTLDYSTPDVLEILPLS